MTEESKDAMDVPMVTMYRTNRGWKRKEDLDPEERLEAAEWIRWSRRTIRELARMVNDLGKELGYLPGEHGPH